MFYAYIYRDPRNGEPFYVGKGQGSRARHHLRCKGPNRFLRNRVTQIQREGLTPSIEVIAALDEAHAFFLETCLIAVIGRRDKGRGPLLNYTDGGEGASGRPCSDRARKAVSEANRVRFEDPREREKIGAATRARVVSDETRRKMAETRKRTLTPERHARMVEAAACVNRKRDYPRGVPHSDDHRRAIGEAQKGRVFSAETLARMSAAQRRRFAK